ncbi:MAG: Rrf2 family transcriptional regulator [Planctomycetales bacterium]
MELTQSVAYAICVLLRAHSIGGQKRVSAARIAEGCNFPSRYLYRVLRKMVEAKLMLGFTGPKGGYQLTKKIRDISLMDVVIAIQGPSPPLKLKAARPEFQPVFDHLNDLCGRNRDGFSRQLEKITLNQLARRINNDPA